MTTPFERLRKILALESERGHDNAAIIGGLDKMASFWAPQAHKANLDSAAIDEVVAWLKNYPSLTPAQRNSATAELLSRLVALEHAETSPPPPAVAAAAPPPPPEQRQRPAPPERPARPERQERTERQERRLPAPSQRSTRPAPPVNQEADDLFAEVTPITTVTPARAARPTLPPAPAGLGLDSALTVLQGVGASKAELLAALGLHTIRDALDFYPRRYIDYSNLLPINRLRIGEDVTIIGTIRRSHKRQIMLQGRKSDLVEAVLSDGTGEITLSFFAQPWKLNDLRPNTSVQVSGRVDRYLGRLQMNSPEVETLDQDSLRTGRIVPVYSLTKGLGANQLIKWMFSAVSYGSQRVEDFLPQPVRENADLLPLGEAIAQLHFPDTPEALQAAQHRLAFDEMLLLQLGLRQMRARWQSEPATPLLVDPDWEASAIASLPFSLTGAQLRTLNEIFADIARPTPMNRLVQGDVGSGKTVIAALALALAVQNGKQAAMLAPTAILAEQHYQNLRGVLQNIPNLDLDVATQVVLLQGSTSAAEKQAIYAGLASGHIKVVVGTHAVIQTGVEFNDLAVAVVDEQHRFGVLQRAALRSKGNNPHLLVMTATPIPRTLALAMFSDLDLSVIDELPPGRQPIETRLVLPKERERAYGFIGSQLDKGRQAYIITPLVEESEKTDARSAIGEFERLSRQVFPRYTVGLLHGRMKPAEKDAIMAQFRAGELQVLVSTTVIEVGVDVPNATIMLIEDANRFGLSQLHQLRGRVGRGEHQSYCLLMAQADPNDLSDNAAQRLEVMEASSDGFALAEKDLELRGPGSFMGTAQAGHAAFKMAELTDMPLLNLAQQTANDLLTRDPNLTQPEHAQLAHRLQVFWQHHTDEIS